MKGYSFQMGVARGGRGGGVGALPATVGAKNAAINKSRGGQETDKALYSIRMTLERL